MTQSKPIVTKQDTFDFNVNGKDAIIIKRQFLGNTQRDINIEKLSLSNKPFWLKVFVKMIRFYQKYISKKLGNRCVFDPSCSHYSEVAYRKKGFLKWTVLTIKRLYRCRPQNWGIDEI